MYEASVLASVGPSGLTVAFPSIRSVCWAVCLIEARCCHAQHGGSSTPSLKPACKPLLHYASIVSTGKNNFLPCVNRRVRSSPRSRYPLCLVISVYCCKYLHLWLKVAALRQRSHDRNGLQSAVFDESLMKVRFCSSVLVSHAAGLWFKNSSFHEPFLFCNCWRVFWLSSHASLSAVCNNLKSLLRVSSRRVLCIFQARIRKKSELNSVES